MNNIFLKNIAALAKKNLILAEKLTAYTITETPQLVQTNGAYNLLYKNQTLHNEQNPLREAQEIFSMAENSPVAIHLVFGMGLGYLFQVVSLNSLGTVILYEPDLNILKNAFLLVDFSNDILKENVFISDDLEQAGEYIHQKSNMKNTPLLLTTVSYRNLHAQKFNDLVTKLQQMVGSYGLDLKYTKERFYSLVLTILKNIPYLVKETPILELKDRFKGKTAVVVSAGPTLDKNIEQIKKYRENIVLIVVGTAMKAISKHGLTPDFLCIIETYDCSKQLEGIDLSEVNFVIEPFSNTNLRKFNFKNRFSHISSNLPVNSLWSELSDIKIDEYLSKGTVSYTALNCARILGCSKIILAGQDLAYIEGQCYSKDSAYKDLVCKYSEEKGKWEIQAKDFENFTSSISNSPAPEVRKKAALSRLENLNNSLYYVKGINGDMIPTESVYAAFIQPLTEYTQMHPQAEYINTSLVGAQIDGFKNMPIEEALKDSEKINDRDVNTDFEYDIEKIISNLDKEKENLNSALKIVSEGQKLVQNLNNDLKRYRNAGVEVLKSLKKLSANYLQVSSEYSKNNKLFDFITTSERIDLDYEMKMTREFTPDTIKNLADKISVYYNKAEVKIKRVIDTIEQTIGEIK